MQDAPNKETLLLALAKFLVADVRPQVQDPRLSFRLLIAANLAAIVAQECSGEDEQNAKERARLMKLFTELPQEPELSHVKELAALKKGNELLAKAIKERALDTAPGSAAFEHVKKTLAEKLAIDNPRFDATRDLP